jgi:FlgD Ig-like domain
MDLLDDHGLVFVAGPTVSKQLLPGAKVDWTIDWTSDYSSPALRDTVRVVNGPPGLQSILLVGQSNVEHTVRKVANGYRHTMVVNDCDCVPGAAVTFKPKSSVQVWDTINSVEVVKSTPTGSVVGKTKTCIQ